MKTAIRLERVGPVTIDDFRRSLSHITQKFLKSVVDDAAPLLNADRDKNYSLGRDTDSRPWLRRDRKYSYPILQRTGRLRRSLKTRAVGLEFVTSTKVSYAQWVDRIRPIVPRTIPRSWTKIMESTFRNSLSRVVRGKQ